jgi:hypothetical protein
MLTEHCKCIRTNNATCPAVPQQTTSQDNIRTSAKAPVLHLPLLFDYEGFITHQQGAVNSLAQLSLSSHGQQETWRVNSTCTCVPV